LTGTGTDPAAEPDAASAAEPDAASPAEPDAASPAEPDAASPAEPDAQLPATSDARPPVRHIPGGGVESVVGTPLRRYPVAVSAGAMALAWARQEAAPQGAAVVVGRELYPLNRLGRPWQVPPEQTLACAVVLRPDLPAASADAMWLVGGLIAKEGAEAASGLTLATWWPDSIVLAATRQVVGTVKADVQLGPGIVRSAVLSIRLDLGLLGLGPEGAEVLLEALIDATHRAGVQADGPLVGDPGIEPGSAGSHARSVSRPDASPPETATLGARYTACCGLIGAPVRATLMPKGELRGYAHRVDEVARLHVRSATGMIEQVPINALRALEVL
jgi:hypothetical protein